MKEYRILSRSVKRANDNLIAKGVSSSSQKILKGGVIVVKTYIDGAINIREISKDKINEAYEKSLKDYAEKL